MHALQHVLRDMSRLPRERSFDLLRGQVLPRDELSRVDQAVAAMENAPLHVLPEEFTDRVSHANFSPDTLVALVADTLPGIADAFPPEHFGNAVEAIYRFIPTRPYSLGDDEPLWFFGNLEMLFRYALPSLASTSGDLATFDAKLEWCARFLTKLTAWMREPIETDERIKRHRRLPFTNGEVVRFAIPAADQAARTPTEFRLNLDTVYTQLGQPIAGFLFGRVSERGLPTVAKTPAEFSHLWALIHRLDAQPNLVWIKVSSEQLFAIAQAGIDCFRQNVNYDIRVSPEVTELESHDVQYTVPWGDHEGEEATYQVHTEVVLVPQKVEIVTNSDIAS